VDSIAVVRLFVARQRFSSSRDHGASSPWSFSLTVKAVTEHSPVTAFLFYRRKNIMFGIQTQLFEGKDIRFGPIDHETHPEIEAKWTHDAEFMRLMEIKPVRPLSAAMVKKQYEAVEKEMEEEKNLFYFTIRAREDDRLIGKALIEYVDWTNGNGYIRFGIGEPEARGKGYGSQALNMLLRYAFGELNLFRVTAVVPAYNECAIRLVQKFKFVEEVRRRKALHRDGEFWDILGFGLLNAEWREAIAGVG
jgi:RimJ/RimL family protein N-acetyltransferase